MLIEVRWRKDKIDDHEIWTFWSCNKCFCCICFSIHKKRSPRRIFLEFAKYRPLRNFEFIENGSSFLVEERFIYKKIGKHEKKLIKRS
jgi:hypothetical protein